MTDVEKLAKILSQSKSAVFFGGAGMSTESGIPDFRSASGIYTEPPTTKVAGFLGLVSYCLLHYQAIPVVPTVLLYTYTSTL